MKKGLGAIIVAALFASTTAHAQNADSFFFGDEAALSAGAVVASGTDSGALWYNPAGFATLKRASVSASASTFGIRIRKIPRALRVSIPPIRQNLDLSSADIISIPNAVVIASQLGDRFAIAGGLLTTSRDVRAASEKLGPQTFTAFPSNASVVSQQRIEVTRDASKYHAGAAFAAKITDSLRVGGGLFVTYSKETRTLFYSFRVQSSPEILGFATASLRATGSIVGLTGQVGAQYDVTNKLSLGLTIRAPEMSLLTSIEGSAVTSSASVGTATPKAELNDAAPKEESQGGKIIIPARAFLGVAYWLGPRSWIEVGVDGAHGLPDSKANSPMQPQLNGRAGFRYLLTEEWIIGGGLFSDRATLARMDSFVTTDRVDYYGFTAGVSKRTPLALAKAPWPEALVLVTTFSLRASMGFGEARAIAIGDDAEGAGNPKSDVTYFELMPYLSSSVLF